MVDRYTVKFLLHEPFVWLIDVLANLGTWIIPREVVEQFGDLKKSSAIGTGRSSLSAMSRTSRRSLSATRLLPARAPLGGWGGMDGRHRSFGRAGDVPQRSI